MSSVKKLGLNQIIFIIPMVLIVLLTGCGGTTSEKRVFVIGELANVGTAPPVAPPADSTPTVPPTATPTTATAVPLASFTTNGTISWRKNSFHTALEALGYVEGQNVKYIYDPAASTEDKRPAAAQALVDAKVDVIIAYGTAATLTAQKAVAGTNIPVIFVGTVDPVELGIVKSLQNTEGNITGVGGISDVYAKQLEWLLLLNPDIKRIYVPHDSLKDARTARAVKAVENFAAKSNLEVIAPEVSSKDTEESAREALKDVDAIISVGIVTGAPNYTQLGIELHIPTTTAFPTIMDTGVLLSYNYTEEAVGTAAARFADRILKGAKPSELPVEIAQNSLALNLKTAQSIGLTIPNDILQQAAIIVR